MLPSGLSLKDRLKIAHDRQRIEFPVMIWRRKRFEIYCAHSIRLHLKRSGFWWDPQHKCWWTASRTKAYPFKQHANRKATLILTSTLY